MVIDVTIWSVTRVWQSMTFASKYWNLTMKKDPDTCNIVKKQKMTISGSVGECYRPQQSPDSFQWKTIIQAQLKQQLHINKRSLANRIKRMQNNMYYFHSNLSPRITGCQLKQNPNVEAASQIITDQSHNNWSILVTTEWKYALYWSIK